MVERLNNWWGDFHFPEKTQWVMRCAEVCLEMHSAPHQWWLGYEWQQTTDQDEPSLKNETSPFISAPKHEQRFVFAELPDRVIIRPALADRPVVCRPAVSVNLLPFQEVTLFVCLPLWLKIASASSEQTLLDIPTVRVCDSWFGPNTREGVLSYASQVSEQLDVKPITSNKARAVIEVRIQNQSEQMLTLDKISVPAPNLNLYMDKEGQFWTQRITLVRRNLDDAILSLDDVMSGGLALTELELVSAAREDIGRSKITKAISALFG